MGDLSLRNVEIENLKTTLQKMKENKIKADNAYISKIEKNFKLTKQLEKYEDESLITHTLSEVEKNIWVDINSTIIEL